jgi:hypothetical protein
MREKIRILSTGRLIKDTEVWIGDKKIDTTNIIGIDIRMRPDEINSVLLELPVDEIDVTEIDRFESPRPEANLTQPINGGN